MRRIWNLFGDEKKAAQSPAREEGSEKDGEEDQQLDKATQTLSREEIKEPTTPEARTPVKDEKSVDEGAKKRSKNRRKKLSVSRSSEGKTPKTPKSMERSVGKRKRSKEVIKVNRSKENLREDKHVVVAEAREIAAKEDNEEFENDGKGAMARSKIKTRDLKWKGSEEPPGMTTTSDDDSHQKKPRRTPKKVAEARDVNKADDEEFENDGKGAMARSKIKTRDLKWKGNEESPGKTTTSDDDSHQKKPRRTPKKVAEARDVNKADDEEFENDGKAAMARSKIKTRDLKWKSGEHMTDASPGKTGSGSDSGGSEQKKPKKVVKPKVVEARDVNKADDEEFENEGGAMAKSKIKSRDLKWKKEEPEKPVIAEARVLNKEDDEEFENEGKSMARSKIKSRDLKWKKEEAAATPRSQEATTDSNEARSPIRIVEAREVNKADDEEFENEGKSMARSKIKSRDLQWKKEDVSPSKSTSTDEKIGRSVGRVQRTPEKKDKEKEKSPSADSPDAPTQRSIMQQLLPEKKKDHPSTERTERTERSVMLAPTSPSTEMTEKTQRSVMLAPSVSASTERTERSVMMAAPASPSSTPKQSTVRIEESKENIEKSSATRSHHSKNGETSRESADKSFMRRLRPSLSLSRKSKTRAEKKAEKDEKEREKTDSSSQHSQASTPDKSTKERSSRRLDVVDRSMKSIKSIFKKSDDTKKKPEELLPHVERDARDVQDARRLMEMMKRNNVFENALFPGQNETLRAHFTSGSRKLSQDTMDLLFKAADFVLDKILFRGEELDDYIDNQLKTFILNRTKSRTMIVELLLKNAEFLPQVWGGRTVVLMRSEEEVSVAPEDEKSKKEARSSKKD